MRAEQPARAEREHERALTQWRHDLPAARGRGALAGAGPGGAGLITLATLRRLQQADVILHDRRVSRDVLAFAHAEARIIDVGKTPGDGAGPQEHIHRLMALHTQTGRLVVRLQGRRPRWSSAAAVKSWSFCAPPAPITKSCPASRPRRPARPTLEFR